MNKQDKQALHAWKAIVQALEHIAKKYDCKLQFTHSGRIVDLSNGKGGYLVSIEELRSAYAFDDVLACIEEQIGHGDVFGCSASEEVEE